MTEKNFPFQKKARGQAEMAQLPTSTLKHRPWQRTEYSSRRVEYAATYGVSPDTITTWVRVGEAVGRLPPLENPDAMRKWKRQYVSPQAKLKIPRAQLATRYQTTPRQITRWLARGRQLGETPPLDKPAALSRWLIRRGFRLPRGLRRSPALPKRRSRTEADPGPWLLPPSE